MITWIVLQEVLNGVAEFNLLNRPLLRTEVNERGPHVLQGP